jgi:hypothetical protein
MALTGIGYYPRREVVQSRSTRVSSPEITLKWSLMNLFAHLTASCGCPDSSGAFWDSE